MKRFYSLLFALTLFVSAQSQDFKLKKEILYSNDNAVCRIEKIKQKGFLSIPSFEIQSLEAKPLASLHFRSLPSKVYASDYSWYSLVLADGSDSIQFLQDELLGIYRKGFLIQRDDILGQMIVKYNLVADNAMVPANWARLKTDYATDHNAAFAAKVEKEGICIEALKQPVTTTAGQEIAVVVATQTPTSVVYEVRQNDKVIATVTANGSEKSLKDQSAEYDYSSGIGSLDGITPLSYVFNTPDGCTFADYFGEEKMVRTRKETRCNTRQRKYART